MTTITDTVRTIESGLARNGALCTNDEPTLIAVYTDPDLPRGWIRLSDDHADAYGDATAIADALADCKPIGDPESDYERVWAALGGVTVDRRPHGSNDWPDDQIAAEQIGDGTPNDNPVCVVRVETNAGPRFVCGPHGTFACALHDTLSNGAPLYGTRQEAIDAHEDSCEPNEPETAHCGCGRITGVCCEWSGPLSDMVVVEHVPQWQRASHAAAGNRGQYPHNGADRVAIHRDCADLLVDDDWTSVVDGVDVADYVIDGEG